MTIARLSTSALLGCAMFMVQDCGKHGVTVVTPRSVTVSSEGRAATVYVCYKDTIQWHKERGSNNDFTVHFTPNSPLKPGATAPPKTDDGIDQQIDAVAGRDYPYELTPVSSGAGSRDVGFHVVPNDGYADHGVTCRP